MTTHASSSRLVGVALSVLLLASLAACAEGTAARSSIPVASNEPTPTPTPAPDAELGPLPRIDAGCSDLVDPSALAAFFGDTGTPLVELDQASTLTPEAAATVQLGGLVCDWTTHPQPSYWTGAPDDSQSVRLRVLPEGLEQAAEYVATYQIADPTYGDHVQGPRCVVGGRAHCELFGAIGPTWVEYTADGIAAGHAESEESLRARFLTLTDPLVAQLTAATPGGRWEAPSTATLDACEAAVTMEQIADLTGLPVVWFGEYWDGPRVGQYSYATATTGAKRCSFGIGGEQFYGAVSFLPAGAWAFDRYRQTWLEDGGVAQPVAGLSDEDAVLRCADPTDECRLDLALDGHWVAVVFPPVPEGESGWWPEADYQAARDSIVSLGAAIVANVGPTDGA